MNWIPLTDKNQISEIKNQVNPSIIFKHSTRCNISAFALKMFERSWEDKMDIKCYFLDILNHRELSNFIAEEFKVHHESPQLLLIKKAECILDASHSDISAAEVFEVLESNYNSFSK